MFVGNRGAPAQNDRMKEERLPCVLIVPGWRDSGPGHWQSLWAEQVPGARRVHQDNWVSPTREAWVDSLAGQVLGERLAAKSIPEARDAGNVVSMVEDGIDLAHNLARGLYPVEMDAEGLMAAFHELANNLTKAAKVRCSFDCDKPVLIHDDTVATHLYRITQEAVRTWQGAVEPVCLEDGRVRGAGLRVVLRDAGLVQHDLVLAIAIEIADGRIVGRVARGRPQRNGVVGPRGRAGREPERALARPLGAEQHATAPGRVGDRILDQIAERLAEPARIAGNDADLGLDFGHERKPGARRRLFGASSHVGAERGEVHFILGEQQAAGLALGEVEHDGFFPAVQPDEIAALSENGVVIAPGEIAFRAFDLDHSRAGVGKPRRAKGRRNRLFDGDDDKAGERLAGARQ